MTNSDSNPRKKILFLTSRFPWPLEKGDKLRAYHFIRELSAYADIYLFAVNEKDISASQLDALNPFCKAVKCVKVNRVSSAGSMLKAVLGQTPFQAAYFYSGHAMKELHGFVLKHQPEIVFCHLLRMAPYANQLKIKRKYIDLMDAFSKAMERYVSTAPLWIKPVARQESRRLVSYEIKLAAEFSAASIISEQDRSYLPGIVKGNVTVIPNGVDTEYYHPTASEIRQELIFLGNMSYIPNVASVAFAVKRILPELEKIHPGCRFLIAGATPSAEVKALAGDNVKVSGWLDDVRTELAASSVMIAPMLISVGQQNKILQAMAMNIPCVVSSLAGNAIGAENGKDVLIADTPSEYASHIHRLLTDDELRRRIITNAYTLVHKQYSWKSSGKMLAEQLNLLD